MTQATRPDFINCAHCGQRKSLGERGRIPAFCSDACRVASRRAPNVIKCAHCGGSATVRSGAVYCSPTCRNAANYAAARRDGRYDQWVRAVKERRQQQAVANAKPCPYCGDLMTNVRRKQCGKLDCKRAFNAERMREWQRSYQSEHGQWYRAAKYTEQQREYGRRRYKEQPHWRVRYPEAAALSDARRRMLIEQATKGEPFAPKDVHERDQWMCGLCRRPVDPGLAWPHPMSASVDHIVPLSRGGEHSMANVQCAHLSCNSRKCDQVIEEISEVEAITAAIINES